MVIRGGGGRCRCGALQRDLAALDRDEKRVRGLARLAVQFLGQRLFQKRVLPQGSRLVAALGVKAHDELVRQLVARLDPHQFLGDAGIGEGIGGNQLFQVVRQGRGQERPQLRPFDLQPGLEDRRAGLGRAEKLALPQGRRCKQRILVMHRRRDQLAEAAHVQVEGLCLQSDGKAVGLDHVLVLRSQHFLQLAQRLAQAGARQCLGRGVPQKRSQLFAVHPLAGRQQEKAKKQPRLARPERQVLSGRDTRDPAGTEEIDLEAKHAIPFGMTGVNDAQRHAAFQQTTTRKSTVIRHCGARLARRARIWRWCHAKITPMPWTRPCPSPPSGEGEAHFRTESFQRRSG